MVSAVTSALRDCSLPGVNECSRSSPLQTAVQLASALAVAARRTPERNDADGGGLLVAEGDALTPQQVAHGLRLEGEIEVGDIVGGRIALRAHLDALDEIAGPHRGELLEARKSRHRHQAAQKRAKGGLLALVQSPILGGDGIIGPRLHRVIADREYRFGRRQRWTGSEACGQHGAANGQAQGRPADPLCFVAYQNLCFP